MTVWSIIVYVLRDIYVSVIAAAVGTETDGRHDDFIERSLAVSLEALMIALDIYL